MTGTPSVLRGAEVSVIPLLVAASVLLQQQGKDLDFLLGTGYFASLLAALAAIALVFRHGNPSLGIAIILGTIALRIGKQVLPGVQVISGLYEGALFALMCLAGYAIWKRDSLRIQRQLSAVCLVGLPLMLLQVLGAGEWTQLLRTDFHDVYRDVTQHPTFLVEADELLSGNTLQPRPAGLFASNNGLSLVLTIAAGLTIWQSPRRASPVRNFLLAMVCVLAMSKTVYAAVVGVALLATIVGDVSQRRRALRFVLSMLCGLLIYFLIFPGLWAVNVDLDLWRLNYALRVISLEQVFDMPFVNDSLREWATSQRPILFDVSGNLIERESGIAILVSKMPWALPLAGLVVLLTALTRFKNIDFHPIHGHVVIVGISMVGLNFVTSSIFALYVGSVVATMNKCRRDQGG